MKKKITAVALVVALLAVGIIGGTLAYFTDSKAQTNTFTSGKVGITLDEAVVEKNDSGNLVATYTANQEPVRTSDAQSYQLYPGMTVTKDPTITVASDSENAWVAAKITVKGALKGLIGQEWGNIDITKDNFISGGICADSTQVEGGWHGLSLVYENDDAYVYQDFSKHENNEWVIYVFVKNAQAKDAKIVLFDTVTIPATWTSNDMAGLNNATVTVNAFAAQESGFADCYLAMKAAFPTEFNFAG